MFTGFGSRSGLPFLTLLVALCLQSGCLAPFNRQAYHRAGLISLYPDSVTVGDVDGFFSLPTDHLNAAPGFHDLMTEQARKGLQAQGLAVSLVPVDVELFWARWHGFSNSTKNQAQRPDGSPIGPMGSVIEKLVDEGVIDRSKFDLILVVGPGMAWGEYREMRALNEAGMGIYIVHLRTRPHVFCAFFEGAMEGYDLNKRLYVSGISGYARGLKIQKLPEIGSVADLLEPSHRRDLEALVDPIIQDNFKHLLR